MRNQNNLSRKVASYHAGKNAGCYPRFLKLLQYYLHSGLYRLHQIPVGQDGWNGALFRRPHQAFLRRHVAEGE